MDWVGSLSPQTPIIYTLRNIEEIFPRVLEVSLDKAWVQKLVLMTLEGARDLPLSKGTVTYCEASMSVGCGLSRFHLHMMHVWHCIIQVFNTCVMTSGTLLLFSCDMSGQFCVEKGFEKNCLGVECYVPSTSCLAFALQHSSPALNKPLPSSTPDFSKACLYCHSSGGCCPIFKNTHTHTYTS